MPFYVDTDKSCLQQLYRSSFWIDEERAADDVASSTVLTMKKVAFGSLPWPIGLSALNLPFESGGDVEFIKSSLRVACWAARRHQVSS